MLGNLIFSYTHTQAGNVHSYGQVGQRVAGSRGVVLQGKLRAIPTSWWKISGDHQLRLVVYPIIYKVLYIPGGARFLPSTVWQHVWEQSTFDWQTCKKTTGFPYLVQFRQNKLKGHNQHHQPLILQNSFPHKSTVRLTETVMSFYTKQKHNQ